MKPKHLHAAIVVLSLLVVGTQPALGTKSIPSDTSIGLWDSGTRTYTLTTDVSETIQIDQDDLTLDGAGHAVRGPGTGTGNGVYLLGRTGVAVKDLTVEGFGYGIFLNDSSNNTLTGNTANSNIYAGILLYYCSGNTLTGNTANSNTHSGILLTYSSGNSLTGNTASYSWGDQRAYGIQLHYSSNNTLSENTANSNNAYGILLIYDCSNNTLSGNTTSDNATGIYLAHYSNDNTLTGNTALSNTYGIVVRSSSYNTLSENTASNNRSFGIQLFGDGDGRYSSNNTLTDNAVSYNHNGMALLHNSNDSTLTGNMISHNYRGISIRTSNDNQIYNNNFISNTMQAPVLESTGNVFSLPKPIGGNYWSGWTGPDADGDGFVDYPYIFTGGQDNLPWSSQNGWLNRPPVADAGPDQTAIVGETVQFDGSGSSDPDGTIVSYEWNFGDGASTQSGVVVSHSYDTAGIYTVILTVMDDYGTSAADQTTITVQAPPVANAGPDQIVLANEGATFDGSLSYDTDGAIVSFDWDFGDEVTAAGVIVTHAYSAPGTYTATLLVTDESGLMDTDTAEVTVLTPAQAIDELTCIVEDMNLQQGIENSLDAKLEAMQDALVAANAGVREDAVNKLEAFVNAVEAQRGKQLTDAQADELVFYADWIISALSEPLASDVCPYCGGNPCILPCDGTGGGGGV